MTQPESSRKRFEERFNNVSLRCAEGYSDVTINFAWAAWQAGQEDGERDFAERIAQLCEEMSYPKLAEVIRALAAGQAETK